MRRNLYIRQERADGPCEAVSGRTGVPESMEDPVTRNTPALVLVCIAGIRSGGLVGHVTFDGRVLDIFGGGSGGDGPRVRGGVVVGSGIYDVGGRWFGERGSGRGW